ncbi:MAG TPA: hypothetical protein VG367_17455 [Mucilaginibacter sp.]|nr:hypothetical protein [Mucilaginibacter sp.]
MTTYFQLKNDIRDIRLDQQTQHRIDDIRLKVLENQVAVLQRRVDDMRSHK